MKPLFTCSKAGWIRATGRSWRIRLSVTREISFISKPMCRTNLLILTPPNPPWPSSRAMTPTSKNTSSPITGEKAMKAIRIEEHGGPENLRLRNLELPDLGPGEVRVKLRAAGLNFVDVHLRRGDVGPAGPNFVDVSLKRVEYPSYLPVTPGFDGAGIIEAVGEGVKEFGPGDRVAYTGHLGTYAEASVVPASKLIPLPDDLSFERGASFPHQGMTAHYLIHEYHLPKPGDTVLIHAAAGGLGLLLVQWAKHLGARVIGTVSTEEKPRRRAQRAPTK